MKNLEDYNKTAFKMANENTLKKAYDQDMKELRGLFQEKLERKLGQAASMLAERTEAVRYDGSLSEAEKDARIAEERLEYEDVLPLIRETCEKWLQKRSNLLSKRFRNSMRNIRRVYAKEGDPDISSDEDTSDDE